MNDPIVDRANVAAEALLALGWPIVSLGPAEMGWRVGTDIFTNEELLEFAAWAGISTPEEG